MQIPSNVKLWISRCYRYPRYDYTHEELVGVIAYAEKKLDSERTSLPKEDYNHAKFDFYLMRKELGMPQRVSYAPERLEKLYKMYMEE